MDTLLPTQMFPHLPAHATFVADTNFVSRTQKMFLILFRNILCPRQMFPSLCSPRNIMGNNVSSFTRALRDNKRAFLTPLKVLQIPLSFLCGSPPGGRTYIYSYFYTLSRPSLVNRDSPALPQVRSLLLWLGFFKTMKLLLSVRWDLSVRCREIILVLNRVQSTDFRR